MGFRLSLENHLPQGKRSTGRTPQTQSDLLRDHATHHRNLGNQVMQSLLRAGLVQPKLTIGSINNPAEREADRVAQAIMRSPSSLSGSSTCSCDNGEEVCEECKHHQSPAMIHRSAAAPSTPSAPPGSHPGDGSRNHTPNIVDNVLRSPGHQLDASTRAFFEPHFGQDFSHVRIHSGPEAAASAHSIQAHAYTAGSDIVFGSNQYSPHSVAGRTLLAHELTHVMQQENAGSGSNQSTTIHRQVFGGMPELGDFGEPALEPRIPPPGIEAPPSAPEAPGEIPQGGEQVFPRPTPPTPSTQTQPWFGPQPSPIPPVAPFPGEETEPEEETKRRTCGSNELPYSIVSFPKQGSKGQGLEVKASPLTRCPGNTEGSKPEEWIYKDQFECIKAAGKETDWLRGHILHGKTNRTGPINLHGPGNTPQNLIIIDQSLNQMMLSWIEKVVLKLLYGPFPHVLWYHAWVDSYLPGLEFFADSISVEYGRFDTRTGTELPGYRTEQFKLEKTPPFCPATGIEGRIFPWIQGSGVTTGSEQKFRLCDEELSLPNFSVPQGGVMVALDTKWVTSDGQPIKPSDPKFNCPDKCHLSLYMKRALFPNKEISNHELTVGSHVDLPWRFLRDDMDYYLRIGFDRLPTEGAGSGAGAEPQPEGPPCCLEVDVTVLPFFAPRKSPEPELA